MPTDRHLLNLMEGAQNLPVSITEILKFGRMKRFTSMPDIVAALRESNFLEVSGPEGCEQVKRKIPYDPDNVSRSRGESRTIYVKGFGDEERSSQFDIEAFFAPYGPTNAVRLRRTQEKLFKGSAFVEFQDDETAKKFLELDPKPLWKGKYPLKVCSKKDYTDRKTQEIKDGKMEPAESYAARGRGRGRGRSDRDREHGRGRGRGGWDRDFRSRGDSRGDRDPDDWKKRREDDRASGFKDSNRRNDRKGGRGRGRGRDDRGPHSNDRNRERENG